MPPQKQTPAAKQHIAISSNRQSQALALPLQQIRLNSMQVEELRKKAKEKYPNENIEGAVNQYIRYNDVPHALFVMDGRRYLRDDDIYYHYKRKCWFNLQQRGLQTWKDRGRLFPPQYRDGSLIEGEDVKRFLVHKSERGWARPAGHSYHISSFPTEILTNILKFIVNLPGDSSVRSLRPVLHDWEESFEKWNLDYEIMTEDDCQIKFSAFSDELLPSVTAQKLGDWYGDYWELRRIRHAGIDAQVLQLSLFHDIGTKLLYRHNKLYFQIRHDELDDELTFLTLISRLGQCNIIHSQTLKPLLDRHFSTTELRQDWNGEVPNKVNFLISQIKQRVGDEALAHWISGDSFSYFIYRIGPVKAALIKHLVFKGGVRGQICNWQCSGHPSKCVGDLIDNLRLYIHIIKAFCVCLTDMTLHIEGIPGVVWRPNTTIRETLEPFLASELRAITTLETLKVVGPSDEDLTFTDETIGWLKENAARRAQGQSTPEVSQELKVVKDENTDSGTIEEVGVKCGFCGGGHNYTKCHKCGFCGQIGHTKGKCKAWLRARME